MWSAPNRQKTFFGCNGGAKNPPVQEPSLNTFMYKLTEKQRERKRLVDRERYKKRREYNKEYQKKWQDKNREKIRAKYKEEDSIKKRIVYNAKQSTKNRRFLWRQKNKENIKRKDALYRLGLGYKPRGDRKTPIVYFKKTKYKSCPINKYGYFIRSVYRGVCFTGKREQKYGKFIWLAQLQGKFAKHFPTQNEAAEYYNAMVVKLSIKRPINKIQHNNPLLNEINPLYFKSHKHSIVVKTSRTTEEKIRVISEKSLEYPIFKSDNDIIIDLLNGNEKSIYKLYNKYFLDWCKLCNVQLKYWNKVFKLRRGSRFTSDDIVQEVFIKVVEEIKRGMYQGYGFFNWVVAIIRAHTTKMYIKEYSWNNLDAPIKQRSIYDPEFI